MFEYDNIKDFLIDNNEANFTYFDKKYNFKGVIENYLIKKGTITSEDGKFTFTGILDGLVPLQGKVEIVKKNNKIIKEGIFKNGKLQFGKIIINFEIYEIEFNGFFVNEELQYGKKKINGEFEEFLEKNSENKLVEVENPDPVFFFEESGVLSLIIPNNFTGITKVNNSIGFFVKKDNIFLREHYQGKITDEDKIFVGCELSSHFVQGLFINDSLVKGVIFNKEGKIEKIGFK